MRTKKALLWLTACAMCMSFAACSDSNSDDSQSSAGHEHAWATEWNKDDTNHWHDCTGEDCTEKNDLAAHAWGEGEITTQPTHTTEGEKTFTCECGATKTETVPVTAHEWATEWSKDDTNHWKVCTIDGCEEQTEFGAHDLGDGVVVEETTVGKDGKKKYTCVCGVEEEYTVHIEVKDVTEALNSYIVGDASFAMTEDLVNGYGAFVNGGIFAMPITNGEVSGNGVWATAESTYIANGMEIQTQQQNNTQYRVYLPKMDYTQYKSVSMQIVGGPDWYATLSFTDNAADGIADFSNGTLTLTYDAMTATLTAKLILGENVKTLEITDTAIIGGTEYFTFNVWGSAAYRSIYVSQITATKTETTVKEYLVHTEHAWATEWSKDDTNHWYACTIEGCTETKELAAHVWGEGEITTQPTHTTEGVRTYTCTCGATKTESVPVTAHEWATEWSKDDTNHWYACTIEGCTETKDLAAHVWGEGEITTQPTHTTEGVRTYTCTCGATKTESVPVTAHEWATEWSKDDTNHWYACTISGCTETKDLAAHTWNDGVVTTEPTYEAAGEKTYTCTVCQQTKTEVIGKLNHNYSTEWSKDDTNHWHACTDTDCTAKEDEAAHAWNDGETTTETSYEAAGVKTYTCTVCQHTKTEEIPQLVHNYAAEWSKDDTNHWKACTDEGYETLKDEEAEHAYDAGVMVEEATPGKDGKKKYTCTVCGYEKFYSVHIEGALEKSALNTYVETPDTVANAVDTYQAFVNGGVFAMPVSNGEVSGQGTWTTVNATYFANGLEIQTQSQNSAQYRVYLPKIDYTKYASVSMQIVGGPDYYATLSFTDNTADGIANFDNGTLTLTYDSATATLTAKLALGESVKALAVTDTAIINGTDHFTFNVWGAAAYRSIYVGQIMVEKYASGNVALNTYVETPDTVANAIDTYQAFVNGGVFAMPVTNGEVSGNGTWTTANTAMIANGLEIQTQQQNNAQYRVYLPKIDYTKYGAVTMEIDGFSTDYAATISLTANQADGIASFAKGTLTLVYDSATATLNVTLAKNDGTKVTLAVTDTAIINGTAHFTFDVWGAAAYRSIYVGQIMAAGKPTETPIVPEESNTSSTDPDPGTSDIW